MISLSIGLNLLPVFLTTLARAFGGAALGAIFLGGATELGISRWLPA
jgi:hypothetical protein